MKDLIEALQILLKYKNEYWPTQCDQDALRVCANPDAVSEGDKKRLRELSFIPDGEDSYFISYRFGKAIE